MPAIIDYIRDLRPAEWGSGVDLHGTNLGPAMSLSVKADIGVRPHNVRFTPNSGHQTGQRSAQQGAVSSF
jgi:hypothetical protein